jgi:hypothetical protein
MGGGFVYCNRGGLGVSGEKESQVGQNFLLMICSFWKIFAGVIPLTLFSCFVLLACLCVVWAPLVLLSFDRGPLVIHSRSDVQLVARVETCPVSLFESLRYELANSH